MKKAIGACLLLLATAASLLAQDIPLDIKGGDAKVVMIDKVVIVKQPLTVVTSFPFTVATPANATAALYFWNIPAGVQSVDKGDKLEVLAAPKGSLTISLKAISAKLDKDGRFIGFATQFGSVTFSIGDVPTPPDPKPPDPKPPDPPMPPAPIPLAGLRVLIVYESADSLPEKQRQVIYSKQVRDYLDAKCPVGPDGKQHEWWMLDKDTPTSGLPKHWQDAMKRPRQSLPWIIISNHPTGGFEGPLPANVSDTMDLLKKFGG